MCSLGHWNVLRLCTSVNHQDTVNIDLGLQADFSKFTNAESTKKKGVGDSTVHERQGLESYPHQSIDLNKQVT